MSTSTLPYLLTIPEVADLLRTTKMAVYHMVGRGQLPGVVRLGRRVLLQRDDLLQWVAESRAASSGRSR